MCRKGSSEKDEEDEYGWLTVVVGPVAANLEHTHARERLEAFCDDSVIAEGFNFKGRGGRGGSG